jgi:hypothetical protein
MHPFLSAVIGGALIGFSVVLLMFLSGRVAGISGIVGGLLPPKLADDWRLRLVAFLRIDGGKVVYEKYDMPTGVFPYNVDIVPSGEIAIVANNGAAGAADGNVDTVSVIDLQQNPPRVIDHVVVGGRCRWCPRPPSGFRR